MMDDSERHAAHDSKARRLRRLLVSDDLQFLMEAHNGLSARIAEEAGFAGIWASGLTLSATCGVRDRNELSWTQVVDTLELMSDATSIPILLDGDTGYGDFNNVRRLVRKLEQRGIAGVCIEDKNFPKTNSFIRGEQQVLADIDEFCGKIKAGKDCQNDPDFCIVARVEALIAGLGEDEALRRAHAYADAGADAVLIHSKRADADEILSFTKRWGNRVPLVIVPTTYHAAPTDVFRRAGISMVIWANHLLRASISAMQETAAQIQLEQSLVNVERRIAPVKEVFRLQGADELDAAEQRYAATGRSTRAIILAASRGDALASLTEDRPKAMVPVAGRPVLDRLVERLRVQGVTDITVVAGYRSESIDIPGVEIVENPDYAHTGELRSLRGALDRLGEDNLLIYGDLLFRDYVLSDLLDMDAELAVVVDSSSRTPDDDGSVRDLADCSTPDDRGVYRQDVELRRVHSERSGTHSADGRWIGMLRVRGEGRRRLEQTMRSIEQEGEIDRAGIPDLLNRWVEDGQTIKVMYIHGHWLDVNNLEDLRRADEFARGEYARELT